MLYSKGPSQADPIFPLRPWSSIVEGVDVTSLDRFERACVQAGNPYGRGTLNTDDLLVLTSFVELHLVLKSHLLFYKTSYLNKEAHCTKPSSPSVGVPWYMAQCLTILS
jgi:hypothetical protein